MMHERPLRHSTTRIVVHRIDVAHLFPTDGSVPAGVHPVEWFFTCHPEGVATVTVPPGDITRGLLVDWERRGIPRNNLARAFVPYHYVIDDDGETHRFLDDMAIGAHAYGVNRSSIGVAVSGDFREHPPTDAAVLACKKLLRELLVEFDGAKIVGHDDVRRVRGQKPKHCPGALFPIDDVRSWAERAAEIIKQGAVRR